MQVDNEEQVYSQDDINKSRAKREMVNPKKWQRNHNEQLRMEGKAYKGVAKIDGKKQYCVARNERILGARCCSKSCEKTRKCGEIKDRNRGNIQIILEQRGLEGEENLCCKFSTKVLHSQFCRRKQST
ncbi:hypothetical protein LOTGIDRAFT_160044 [Lottia gigantea]|uniref:Uncharacterized protein n=1 Tax=Lottia gigantea TaxID=225164 RepID=V4AQV2_LOTGI|nr:hypothetical protein LOTGIDRAFT_160044 [Lottia gigantea]ESO96061.1 hypothetical protein LOTGIDRAFT_160044 [Lottia gigantea]